MVAQPFRPRLGLGLQDIVMGQQPPMMPPMGGAVPAAMGAKPEQPRGLFREGGMGRHLAGVIGDALLQRADMAPVYSPMMQENRAAKASEAQWHRSREAQRADRQEERQWSNEDWHARQDYERANPAPSTMERDAAAWDRMSPPQRAAYQEAQRAGDGDRFVTMTLPNGQFYAGPQSGLVAALGNAPAAAPPEQAPDRLPADFFQGGSGGNATGGFRP